VADGVEPGAKGLFYSPLLQALSISLRSMASLSPQPTVTHAMPRQLKPDEERTRILNSFGFRMVRVTNVDENIDGVQEMIALTLDAI
jgi:hypothetical protein